jgi:hypothetical protein
MKKITLLFSLFCISLGYSQMPTSAAPTPPARVATDVISIYGGAYTPISGVNTNPNWGQNTVVTEVAISGDNALQYANFNYQGMDWVTLGSVQNISNMEYLHVDVWTNSQAPNIFVISSGAEIPHPISSVTGSWQSLNIPVAGITGNLTNAIQFKFDGGNGGTIYLDNLYFWKTASAPGTPVIGSLTIPAKFVGDAPFAITNPTSDSPGAFSFTSSNTAVATIIGNMVTIVGAGSSTITANQAASAPYLAGSVSATLVVTGAPTVAAPTPPTRNAWDVISLFSNTYTNIAIDTWSASWDDSDISDLLIAGNDTKYIQFGNFIGVDFSGAGHHIDATDMTKFHMDFWSPNPDLIGKVFNPKFSQWGGTAGEVSALLLTYLPTETGTWISIDAPLSTFAGSQNRNDLAQFIITSNLGTAYVDNIYLYRPATLANTTFENSNLKMYPNPATTSFTIDAVAAVEKVSVYNLLGQEVISVSPNNQLVTLDISNLKVGVYVVKATVNGAISTSRIIKE